MSISTRRTTRTVRLLALLALCAVGAGTVVGCGSEKADSLTPGADQNESAPQSGARARQVADAWEGSRAAEKWHEGYYPMAAVVQVPEKGFHDEADKHAYETANFDVRVDLPAPPHKDGEVTWESGGSLTLPLVGAQEAYKALDRNSSPGRHLTVTGAKLGEMTVVTSRGQATVPAWLFTLEGYDTPLKRAAVSPSELPEPPIKPATRVPDNVLRPLGGLVETSGDGRSVTVRANHGSCDDGPGVAALETDGSVVLSASTVGSKDGACTADMRAEEVTVKLHRPVGNRILLDAHTGRPVPYGQRPGTAQSWS